MAMASSAIGTLAAGMARRTTLRPVHKKVGGSTKVMGRPWKRGRIAEVRASELDGASLDSAVVEVTGDVSSGDRIISVLFTAAVIGLLVITVGAIYLAIADAQDRKAEEAEKTSSGVASLKEKRKKKKSGSGTGGGKGFGKD